MSQFLRFVFHFFYLKLLVYLGVLDQIFLQVVLSTALIAIERASCILRVKLHHFVRFAGFILFFTRRGYKIVFRMWNLLVGYLNKLYFLACTFELLGGSFREC